MRFPTPRLYLGTMTFGWSQTSSKVDESVATEMLKHFLAADANGVTPDLHYVDAARIYSGGTAERMLGSALRALNESDRNSVALGTKAHPSLPGGLGAEGMKGQFRESLDAMGVSGVGEYYLHQPDTEHTLLESLKCAHELISEGRACALGMSNYHASEMERAFELCEAHGLTKPTVYQGLYNPLNRLVEKELIPLLKKNKCAFVAYNPLAAGLLTGKHRKSDSEVQAGRFKDNQNYLPRFYTDSNFAALEIIRTACEESGISMVEASYRWLLRHSALTEKDGILLGASSVKQLDENLEACASAEKGPLPDRVLKAFDEAWKVTEAAPFPYWRSYSLDMPGRDDLDQGATYSASK